jgi:hypothetical protein
VRADAGAACSNAVEEEYLVGRFNASVPFEVLTQPDRTDHTRHLDQEGPAWTTALLTRYGGGDLADQWGSGWYSAEWVRWSLFGVLPIKRWAPRNLRFKRPRQAAVTFKSAPGPVCTVVLVLIALSKERAGAGGGGGRGTDDELRAAQVSSSRRREQAHVARQLEPLP